MFEDVYAGVKESLISEQEIMQLYGSVAKITMKNFQNKNCKSSECHKLRTISIMTRNLRRKYKRNIISDGNYIDNFKLFALKKIKNTLRKFQNISDELTTLVERSSLIWKSEKECYNQGTHMDLIHIRNLISIFLAPS